MLPVSSTPVVAGVTTGDVLVCGWASTVVLSVVGLDFESVELTIGCDGCGASCISSLSSTTFSCSGTGSISVGASSLMTMMLLTLPAASVTMAIFNFCQVYDCVFHTCWNCFVCCPPITGSESELVLIFTGVHLDGC